MVSRTDSLIASLISSLIRVCAITEATLHTLLPKEKNATIATVVSVNTDISSFSLERLCVVLIEIIFFRRRITTFSIQRPPCFAFIPWYEQKSANVNNGGADISAPPNTHLSYYSATSFTIESSMSHTFSIDCTGIYSYLPWKLCPPVHMFGHGSPI